jgi:hypothetical protein
MKLVLIRIRDGIYLTAVLKQTQSSKRELLISREVPMPGMGK